MTADLHEPMVVRRTKWGDIEPPLNQAWDALTKLRWQAGVVLVDSGIRARITTNCYSEPAFLGRFGPQRFRPDIFGVAIGNATLVGLNYNEVWHYLNGVSNGARAVRGVPAL